MLAAQLAERSLSLTATPLEWDARRDAKAAKQRQQCQDQRRQQQQAFLVTTSDDPELDEEELPELVELGGESDSDEESPPPKKKSASAKAAPATSERFLDLPNQVGCTCHAAAAQHCRCTPCTTPDLQLFLPSLPFFISGISPTSSLLPRSQLRRALWFSRRTQTGVTQ